MISIYSNESIDNPIEPGILEGTATTVLAELSTGSEVDLTIAIETDEQLHQLNLQFLGIDAPTDVLSFPAGDIDPDTGRVYLGDIIISLPRAISQAVIAGHTPQAEIQLLVIHGILHLSGYDHTTPELKDAMWRLQSHFLDLCGITIKKIPED